MPAPILARRAFAGAAAAWAFGPGRTAQAAPTRFAYETDVWTGSVLMTAEGHSFTLRDLQRPITLLKLWAGWCPACAAEMPELAAMASAMGSSVEVILVSYPQYWAADQVAAQRRGVPFRLATFAPATPAPIVTQALQGPEGFYSIPRSLAFRSRDQSIVMKRERGAEWASAEMLNQVKSLMA